MALGGLAAAGAGAGAALRGAGRAEAASGGNVVVDGANTGSSTTTLSGTRLSVTATTGTAITGTGPSTGIGVEGNAPGAGARGVYGNSAGASSRGVYGYSTGSNGIGVSGQADAAGSTGVRASSTLGTALLVSGNSSFTGDATFQSSVSAGSLSGNGSAVTALNGGSVSAGVLGNARLSANVPMEDASSNVFSGTMTAASFSGDGSGLMGVVPVLNATKVVSGTSQTDVSRRTCR